MSPRPKRLDEEKILGWLRRQGLKPAVLEPLPGDVSPRRYVRVELADGKTRILAVYPPELRSTCSRFLATTDLCRRFKIPVPEVVAGDCQEGFMLLEDVGRSTLFDLRRCAWDELAPYLDHAATLVSRIQGLPADAVGQLNPPLDGELLRREIRLTWDAFLEPRRLTGGEELTRALKAALDSVCQRLGAEPSVPTHRDLMARNLVPGEGGRVTVLDHQDLRLGPPGYDLASLLNDSLFPPRGLVDPLLQPLSSEMRASYHRAAVQRTLKAIGTFVSFSQRGSDRHLPLIPPTLTRTLHHLRHLPETSSLVSQLQPIWEPELSP